MGDYYVKIVKEDCAEILYASCHKAAAHKYVKSIMHEELEMGTDVNDLLDKYEVCVQDIITHESRYFYVTPILDFRYKVEDCE